MKDSYKFIKEAPKRVCILLSEKDFRKYCKMLTPAVQDYFKDILHADLTDHRVLSGFVTFRGEYVIMERPEVPDGYWKARERCLDEV